MFRINKNGFIFIETIIVVCVLTVSLMSLYANYSKILTNTKELNTYDTTEYNYKTHFIKQTFDYSGLTDIYGNTITGLERDGNTQKCYIIETEFSDDGYATVCLLMDIMFGTNSIEDYLEKEDINGVKNYEQLDAYIIDYLLTQDIDKTNDHLFIVKYKKEDKQNKEEYLTYISSLNYYEME